MENIGYECKVYVPSKDNPDAVIYMQDGDGSQLNASDYRNGYDAYIDYEILDGWGKGDGGIYMYKNNELEDEWTDKIRDALIFIYDFVDDNQIVYELEPID